MRLSLAPVLRMMPYWPLLLGRAPAPVKPTQLPTMRLFVALAPSSRMPRYSVTEGEAADGVAAARDPEADLPGGGAVAAQLDARDRVGAEVRRC